MNKLRKALNYYQDISKKRAYFPNNIMLQKFAKKATK